MKPALLSGFLLGAVWAAGEIVAARPQEHPGDLLAQFSLHVALTVLAVLAAFALLGLTGRWRVQRAALAPAIVAGGIAALVVFLRVHFARLENQPWSSPGHLMAFGAGCLSAVLVGAAVFLAVGRMQRLPWVQKPIPTRLAAVLLLPACVFAARSVIPRFEARVEAAELQCRAPYNVVLITLDTLRADHLSPYGYDKPTGEALARFGFTRFEQGYAVAPWTRPSTATILTGSYPSVHNAVLNDTSLPQEAVTIAERLAESGFATAHCAANINASDVFGMAQGAQFSIRNPYLVPHPLTGTTIGELLRRRSFDLTDAQDLRRMAVAFLDAAAGRRFFLYFHCEDPHTPYDPPREQLEQFAPRYQGRVFTKPRPDLRMNAAEVEHMIARYDGDIANATDAVAELLDLLDRRGQLERTLVILTADHGEAFDDHGQWNHSSTLYDELLHIPLLVRPPAGLRRVPVVEAQASQIDIVPTVLDYLGFPAAAELPGRSLRALVEGAPAPAEERLLLAECHRIDAWSVRLGRWKLIVTGEAQELYDVEADPRELRDLAREPEQAERMADLHERGRALRADLAACGLKSDRAPIQKSVDTLLRQLGYVDDQK
ncbi:MAG: sulfatase [Planctomycetes bacterium]|nr:sulfatase [Planctomycetota bacterium]